MMQIAQSAGDVWGQLVASSKKAKGGMYTRYVNRNAAIPITWLFWKVGVSPNTVSLLSFLSTHAAFVVLIVFGASIPASIAAYLLLVLGYILDSCDGQLARVTGRTSPLGGWIDHSIDMVKLLNFNMVLGYLALSHAIATELPLWPVFLAVFLNLLSQPAHFFVITLKVELLGDTTKDQFGTGSRGGRLSRFVLNASDYGAFMLLVLLLPWQDAFVPVYLTYGVFIFIWHFARTCRAISRIPAQAARQ
jgi:phosphatidylglycerophosphate synthase